MTALSKDSELKDKLDLLRESYREVLDAVKHQDDKVGRFLTAVAFLVAGSIALGTRTGILRAGYQLEKSPANPVHLPAYLLSLFLFFIMISLGLLVTGMGAKLNPPGDGKPVPSHLFFFRISEMPAEEWNGLWSVDSKAVGQSLIDEYQGEIVNIARRATNKYRRTLYAGAFLQLAILSLVLAAGLGFLADSFPRVSGAGNPVDWFAFQPRLVVAITIAAFALFLALDFWRNERFDKKDKLQRRLRTALILVCPTYAFFTVLHAGELRHVFGTFGFYDFSAAVIALVFAWAVWMVWDTRAKTAMIVGAIGFILVPGSFFSFHHLQLGLLVGAGMIVVVLLALRLFPLPRSWQSELNQTG